MAQHNETGRKGEVLAQQYLKKQHYKILQTNYRICNIEIDIIAQIKKTIVFVEVKTRSSEIFQAPEEAVDINKQRRITIAANTYMQQFSEQYEARFDVIAVILSNDNIQIRHTIEAFSPTPTYR